MNVEFMIKMFEAKRIEAEAFALLVPPEVRRVAATAVHACAEMALDMLEEAPSSPHDKQTAQPKQQQSGLRSIVIE